jgi:Bacterial archaeo-eukaryotic release factor family 3
MHIPALSKNIPAKEKLLAPPPTLALVLPFNPKMTPRHELEMVLRRNLEAAEKLLLSAHAAENAMPVIKRLQQAIRGLNFSTHKRSVALFVSADMARTTYLDFAVEERLIIDRPFRVRDLADCKPGDKEYLVLLLSAQESKMYLKAGDGLRLIKSNAPQTVYAYLNEPPEKSGNFSDQHNRHEVILNKFLYHMDQGLEAVLKAYPVPVFVAGADRVIGHFARITHHQKNIAGYLPNQCLDASPVELQKLLQPLLENWQSLLQQLLLLQMEKAAEAGKLVCGIEAVRKAAACSNSRLVIVQRTLNAEGSEEHHAFYSDGAVDQVVEKVLQSGGDVEKLDPELMEKYGPIALIRYY